MLILLIGLVLVVNGCTQTYTIELNNTNIPCSMTIAVGSSLGLNENEALSLECRARCGKINLEYSSYVCKKDILSCYCISDIGKVI